jgi:hypothetical protein
MLIKASNTLVPNQSKALSEKTPLLKNNMSKTAEEPNLKKNAMIVGVAAVFFLGVIKKFPLLNFGKLTNNKMIPHLITLCLLNFVNSTFQATLSTATGYVDDKKSKEVDALKESFAG